MEHQLMSPLPAEPQTMEPSPPTSLCPAQRPGGSEVAGPSAELREEAGGSEGGWSGASGIYRGEARLAHSPGPCALRELRLPIQGQGNILPCSFSDVSWSKVWLSPLGSEVPWETPAQVD